VLLTDPDTVRKCAENNHELFAAACGDGVNVVVMTDGLANPVATAELLYLGCRGVLSNQASPEAIRKALAAVFEGEIWAPRQIISNLLQKCLFQLGPNALTQREEHILELIASGLTNREIAQTLFITRETVRWHIRSLYSKIGASDRLTATVYAKEVLLLPKESSRFRKDEPVLGGFSAPPLYMLSKRPSSAS
jgi:DNA-binding NarL/FixJ family response regulator